MDNLALLIAERGRGPRPLQARVIRNTRRLLDAGVELLDEEGWAGFHLTALGPRVGLSKRPAQERFSDRTELASELARFRLGPALRAALASIIDAAAADEPSALADAAQTLMQPSLDLRAAAELLIVSQFNAGIAAGIDDGLAEQVRAWCSAGTTAKERAEAARRAYLVCLGLGLLLIGRRRLGEKLPDIGPSMVRLHGALQVRATPASLPSKPQTPFTTSYELAPDDPGLELLLRATLDLVSRHGYDDTSVAAITKVAGVSQGLLFGRYRSKLEMFLDATRRHYAHAYSSNKAFLDQVSADHSPGIAEAVIFREVMDPERAGDRALELEQQRLSWHDEELREAMHAEYAALVKGNPLPGRTPVEARAYWFLEEVMGQGIAALPVLDQSAWSLPFSVVTVPLMD